MHSFRLIFTFILIVELIFEPNEVSGFLNSDGSSSSSEKGSTTGVFDTSSGDASTDSFSSTEISSTEFELREGNYRAHCQEPAVICYFADWTSYRKGKGKFSPEDIDPSLCTHIHYAFALYNETENKIVPADPNNDLDKGYYKKIFNLKKKNPDLKVLLTLGGWTDSLQKYGKMLRNEKLRTHLVEQMTDFLIQFKFDGADIDIEYIGAYQGDPSTGDPSDKERFIDFLSGLRECFNRKSPEKRLLLSIAAPADEEKVDRGYNVPKIAKLCDYISVMAYDIYSKADGYTGLVAPFKPRAQDTGHKAKLTVTNIMKMWISKGAPVNKLAVGLPFYGRTFVLTNPQEHGIGAPTNGDPVPGKYTDETGMLAFYEIIDNIENKGWTLRNIKHYGSYAFYGKQWVGFDNTIDIVAKAKYIKKNGFFGAMVWSLDTDCFQKDTCESGPFTLLQAINTVFERT